MEAGRLPLLRPDRLPRPARRQRGHAGLGGDRAAGRAARHRPPTSTASPSRKAWSRCARTACARPPPARPPSRRSSVSPSDATRREAAMTALLERRGRVPAPARGELRSAATRSRRIDDLLRLTVERGGSDLHLTAGIPPCIRVHGSLRPVEGMARLTPRGHRGPDALDPVRTSTWAQVRGDQRAGHLLLARGHQPLPRQRLRAARRRSGRCCGRSRTTSAACPSSACRRTSSASPTCRAGWCWSPARPVRASRRPWPACSTSPTRPARRTS